MANEKRMIDANKLLRNYEMWIPQLILPQDQRDKDAIETCIAVLKDQPTVDAVEVVRCKDCKYSFKNNGHNKKGCPINDASTWMDDDDFCSYGERRTE